MPRQSEGLTEQLQTRATPDERQMARDIAAQVGVSQNRALRWALRFAWQHARSTTDHTTCPPTSPCAAATRGVTPGRQRTPAGTSSHDQLTITHSATVKEP